MSFFSLLDPTIVEKHKDKPNQKVVHLLLEGQFCFRGSWTSVLLAFPLSPHLSPKVNRAFLKILLGKRCQVPGVDLVRIRKGGESIARQRDMKYTSLNSDIFEFSSGLWYIQVGRLVMWDQSFSTAIKGIICPCTYLCYRHENGT